MRSQRQPVREIEVNVACRWFPRLRLTDTVFDASTLSQNRRRRYQDETIAQGIFGRIVEQAIRAGLVDGTMLHPDSTHLKANVHDSIVHLGRLDRQVEPAEMGAVGLDAGYATPGIARGREERAIRGRHRLS